MTSLNQNELSIWFWSRFPKNHVHWYIGLVSPMYTHCALVLGDWQLNAADSGSEWIPYKEWPEGHYYRSPTSIVRFGSVGLSGPLDCSYLEGHKANKLYLSFHHVLREIGIKRKPVSYTCVDLIKRFFNITDRDDIETPDELFEELV